VTSHISPEMLAALADGEFQTPELLAMQEHLAGCAACTSSALAQTLLKSSIARASQRYAMPPEMAERVSQNIARERANAQHSPRAALGATQSVSGGYAALGWAMAALLLVAITLTGSWFLMERNAGQKMALASANDALVSEVFDQHVAALAASGPPQVISSDNHTVKPWFQGKLPFAFNLPENLPAGIVLGGANFTYLHNQPTAQLLFNIGRHRVSVFVMKKTGNGVGGSLLPERSGFHVMSFASGELEGIAISDVNPARLAELVRSLEEAQTKSAQ
jgi:anti-sigma factor RsiW